MYLERGTLPLCSQNCTFTLEGDNSTHKHAVIFYPGLNYNARSSTPKFEELSAYVHHIIQVFSVLWKQFRSDRL